MIEICTLKRMVLTIMILGLVTIVSVVIETKYEPANKEIKNFSKAKTGLAVIQSTGNTTIVDTSVCPTAPSKPSDCKQCAAWQQDMKDSACADTGYSAEVKCSNSHNVYISCEPPTHIRQRSFWIHEGVWLIVGIISFLFVHFRQSSLDQKLLDRVNKQIASGV